VWGWVLPTLGTAVFVGCLGSAWPAYRASTVDVARALRGLE